MRFADAEVLAQNAGTSIPPLEVRLDLRPGDQVGLYEEVRHPSMGAGYSPLEVLVLGSSEPGWFIGATEDGREIEFHAGNVADVLHGSPSMGAGFFDWVRKLIPPSPSEMAPPPPSPPLLPAPKAEEPKGLIARVKGFFAQKPKEAPPGSLVEVFKKPSGLPAAPTGERPSVISVFAPGEKTIIPVVEQVTAPAAFLAPEEKTVIPFVEAITAPATVLPKSAELEPFLVREQKEKELWSKIISEVAPEAAPIEKVIETFRTFTPAEVQPAAEVIPPNIPPRLHRTLKVLPLPRRSTVLPSIEELARGLATFYEPIEELWDTFRRARQSPDWKESVAKTGFAKEEFETLGTCGGQPTVYDEVSSYFHIPWEEMRNRAVVEEYEDREVWVNTDRIWMDIIAPLVDLVTQAFNLMKPADLPGQIIVERADPHVGHDDPCILTFAYVEGEPLEEPERPVYGGPSTEIETEDPTVGDLQEALERLGQEMAYFFEERNKLDPRDPEYREKLAYLENEIDNRKAMIQEIEEALSGVEEEPEAKRAPVAKKKPAKRGKKKGKGS